MTASVAYDPPPFWRRPRTYIIALTIVGLAFFAWRFGVHKEMWRWVVQAQERLTAEMEGNVQPSSQSNGFPAGTTVVLPTPTQTEEVEFWIVANIEQTSERHEVIGVSNVSARNCGSDNVITYRESLKKATTHDIQYGGAVEAGVNFLLISTIEGELQISNGELVEKEIQVDIEARPNSHLEYKVIWQEVWADGVVNLENNLGETEVITFAARTSLESDLLDPIEVGCN